MKGSEAQKQMPRKLLWMLWFDGKSIPRGSYLYYMAAVRKDTYVPAANKKFVLQMSKLERTFGVDRIPMN